MLPSLKSLDYPINEPIPLHLSLPNMNPYGTLAEDPSTSRSLDSSMKSTSKPSTSPSVNQSSTHKYHPTNMPYFVPSKKPSEEQNTLPSYVSSDSQIIEPTVLLSFE